MAAWEQQMKADQPAWVVLPLEYQGDNDERYLPQPDGSYLAQGYAPTKHTPTEAPNTLSVNVSTRQPKIALSMLLINRRP